MTNDKKIIKKLIDEWDDPSVGYRIIYKEMWPEKTKK